MWVSLTIPPLAARVRSFAVLRQQARSVSCHHVDFQVHALACREPSEVGLALRDWNHVDAEPAAGNLVHGHRHPVDRNRSLGSDETRQLGWRLERQTDAAAVGRALDQRAEAIDMAEDEMAAQLVSQ